MEGSSSVYEAPVQSATEENEEARIRAEKLERYFRFGIIFST